VTVRSAFGYFRLALALTCVVALIARFIWGLGSATFTASNFFAYLTIQSNLVFVIAQVVAGLVALRARTDPEWLTTIRATVLTCTVTAGIVFAFLVQQAGERGFRIDVPWSDQVLHFILPVFAVADWVLTPGRGRALWRSLGYTLAFTLGWGGITLVRGSVVGWYPYFFLDPNQVSGVAEFSLFSGIAISVFAAVGAGVVGLSRLRPVLGRN
jgi:hypothetical protein